MKRISANSLGARFAIGACALLVIVVPAAADDDFELSVEPIVFEAIEADVDTDSAKFEEYGDYGSGFRIPVLAVEGHGKTSDRYLGLWGEDIYRNNARVTMDYGVRGRYGIELDYNKIPHRFGNNATLIWNRTAPGRLELADTTQSFLQGVIESTPSRDFDFIESLLRPFIDSANTIDLGLQRNRFGGRIDFRPMHTFSWAVDYRQEQRNGNRPYGATLGFSNVNEVPEPINYTTTDVALMGEWTGERSAIQFGYRFSEFENDIDTLIWDNPFRITDGTDSRAYVAPTSSVNGPVMGIIDLAANNEADTLFINGKTRFADSWWASGNILSTRMSQDDPFQAYTLNTAIVGINHVTGGTFDPTDPATLPAQRADLETDVLAFNLKVGGELSESWGLKLSYDYYDFDPSVPRLEFDGYVRMHAVWEEVPRVTVPYAYTRENLGVKATWDVSEAGRLSLEYALKQWERENRETESTDEDIFKITYDHDFGPKWDLRAFWETADRTDDGYETEAQEVTFLEPEGINNQPGLRKYLQGPRERDMLWADVYFYPRDAVQLMFSVQSIDEDYPESEFGLISYETMSYNFELSYAPGPDLNFFVFGTLTDGESFQRARQSGGTLSTSPDDTWELTLDEDNTLFGLGLTAQLTDRWTTDVTLRWSEADGAADFFTTPLGNPSSAQDFDNYRDTELLSLQIKCQYELNESSRIGARYWYEDYTLDAFLLQGLTTYESGLIALVPSFGDYQANVFSVFLSLDI